MGYLSIVDYFPLNLALRLTVHPMPNELVLRRPLFAQEQGLIDITKALIFKGMAGTPSFSDEGIVGIVLGRAWLFIFPYCVFNLSTLGFAITLIM